MLPQLNIGQPRVKYLDNVSQGQLPGLYRELIQKNPLLGRIEGQTKLLGWSDLEIRTAQLLMAVASNASLQQRLMELEISLAQKTPA